MAAYGAGTLRERLCQQGAGGSEYYVQFGNGLRERGGLGLRKWDERAGLMRGDKELTAVGGRRLLSPGAQ